MNPLISYIVPVYGTEDYIVDCVKSIKKQGIESYEIILVDDGSPDASPAICDRLGEMDSCIQVIHQINQGLSAARNAGLAAARGEWILFVDSDDTLVRGSVKKVLEKAEDCSVDVVIFSFRNMNEDGTLFFDNRNERRLPEIGIICTHELMKCLANESISSYAWRYVARRQLYCKKHVQFPVGKYFEDVATTYKIFLSASRAVVLHDVVVNYRTREGSILNSRPVKMIEVYKDAFDAYTEREKSIRLVFPNLGPILCGGVLSFFVAALWDQREINHIQKDRAELVAFLNDRVETLLTTEAVRQLSFKRKIKLFAMKCHLDEIIFFLKHIANQKKTDMA